MKTTSGILLSLLTITMGCVEHNMQSCIRGTIIGYESQHTNVVRAPGGGEGYGTGTIYLAYRTYDRDKDQHVFGHTATPCLAIYAPFDVPTIVITQVSAGKCNGLER